MNNHLTDGTTVPVLDRQAKPIPPKPLKLKGLFWFLEDADTGTTRTFSNAENVFDMKSLPKPVVHLKLDCSAFDDKGMKKLTLTAQSNYSKDPGVLFTDEVSPVAIGFDRKDQQQLSIEKTFLNMLLTAPFEDVSITFTARYTDQKGKVQTSKLKLLTTADAPH